MAIQLIMVPGLGNSGPQHWQSLWEARDSAIRRVAQANWDAPSCTAWVKKLDEEIQRADAPVVLVAHSLGCLAVVHWAGQHQANVKAALLVAPPDAERPDFPEEATGFAPIPRQTLPFPTMVVASSNDSYMTLPRAQELAHTWGIQLVSVGEAGHINAASGLGDWPQGWQLLQELLQQAAFL